MLCQFLFPRLSLMSRLSLMLETINFEDPTAQFHVCLVTEDLAQAPAELANPAPKKKEKKKTNFSSLSYS